MKNNSLEQKLKQGLITEQKYKFQIKLEAVLGRVRVKR